ncbi:MAG: cadherin domain-containing protein [Sedimenticola sp.]
MFTSPVAGSATATLSEAAVTDASVFTLAATDDDDDTASLSFSIESQTDGTNFKISGTELQVAAGASLDFETTTSYTLVITYVQAILFIFLST